VCTIVQSADQYGALETGDKVDLVGQQRTASEQQAPGADAAASPGGADWGLSAAGADEQPDSDYIQVAQARPAESSFSRYLKSLSYIMPKPRAVSSITFLLNICGTVNPIKPEVGWTRGRSALTWREGWQLVDRMRQFAVRLVQDSVGLGGGEGVPHGS
jgi:hypothetical protein